MSGRLPRVALFAVDTFTAVTAIGGGLALANGEDELVLARPDGVEIDWLHYDDTWYTVGVALGLDPDELDDVVNDDPAYWCDQATVAGCAAATVKTRARTDSRRRSFMERKRLGAGGRIRDSRPARRGGG